MKATQPQFQSRLKPKTNFGAGKSTLKQDGHFLTESKVEFQIKDKKNGNLNEVEESKHDPQSQFGVNY